MKKGRFGGRPEGRSAMARRSRSTTTLSIAPGRGVMTRALVLACLIGLDVPHDWAGQDRKPQRNDTQQQKPTRPPQAASQPQDNRQPNDKQPGDKQQNDKQQMRGLDEQIQEIKSDVLGISAELSRLEEKLIYPSGTQVAIFIALAKGDQTRLDSVRLQIDGQPAAEYVYSFKELDALRKGGVQRIYVGNVTTGEHQLEVKVDGKLEGGADYSRTEHFTFRKDVKPKQVELTLAGAGNTPITLGEW